MKTFSRCPPLTTMFSAVFEPAQLESWLMSIFAAFGAAPPNFTIPLTLAAVAGSIGVAAGAAAGVGAAGCSSAVSFLPHPANRTTPSKTDRLPVASDLFVFILFPASPLKYQEFAQPCLLLRSALREATRGVHSRGAAAIRRSRALRRCAHPPLLFGRELEDIFDEELGEWRRPLW